MSDPHILEIELDPSRSESDVASVASSLEKLGAGKVTIVRNETWQGDIASARLEVSPAIAVADLARILGSALARFAPWLLLRYNGAEVVISADSRGYDSARIETVLGELFSGGLSAQGEKVVVGRPEIEPLVSWPRRKTK